MEPINNQETLPSGSDVRPVGGGGSDKGEGVELKDFLSKELGKEFPTDEAALKAVKDTFSYVGKVGKVRPLLEKLEAKYGGESKVLELLTQMEQNNPQEPAKVDDSKFVPREQYEKDTFFSKHPELSEDHRTLLEAVAVQSGKPLAEAMELPAFKNVVGNARAFESTERSKSVLHTNPRLAQATDKMTEAKTASQAGNHQAAAKSAVGAVLDAFESKQ